VDFDNIRIGSMQGNGKKSILKNKYEKIVEELKSDKKEKVEIRSEMGSGKYDVMSDTVKFTFTNKEVPEP
jgi:hypothetical protein